MGEGAREGMDVIRKKPVIVMRTKNMSNRRRGKRIFLSFMEPITVRIYGPPALPAHEPVEAASLFLVEHC